MTNLLKALFVSAMLLLTPLAAYAGAVEDKDIDRLMQLFRVREVTESGAARIFNGPRMQSRPPELVSCLRTVFTVDAMYSEFRNQYRLVYTDPILTKKIIAFLESKTGQKILSQKFAALETRQSSIEQEVQLTAAEEVEFDKFSRSPAGQFFVTVSARLDAMTNELVQKMLAKAAEECGTKSKGT